MTKDDLKKIIREIISEITPDPNAVNPTDPLQQRLRPMILTLR
jgi:hypothetical protein